MEPFYSIANLLAILCTVISPNKYSKWSDKWYFSQSPKQHSVAQIADIVIHDSCSLEADAHSYVYRSLSNLYVYVCLVLFMSIQSPPGGIIFVIIDWLSTNISFNNTVKQNDLATLSNKHVHAGV